MNSLQVPACECLICTPTLSLPSNTMPPTLHTRGCYTINRLDKHTLMCHILVACTKHQCSVECTTTERALPRSQPKLYS